MDNNEKVIDDIVTKFKTLNGIEDTEKDELIKLYISLAIQKILNLTNRYVFPKELTDVVLEMTKESWLKDKLTAESISSDSNYIKSVSEEGRSVSFGNSQETLLNTLLSNDINEKLNLRLKEINRYRLLYKVKPKGVE